MENHVFFLVLFATFMHAVWNGMIKYHPDKVSHLGDDLQRIAEDKFKAVNNAYQTIKKERKI